MKKVIPAITAVLFLFTLTLPKTTAKQNRKEQILHFPKEYSLGEVYIQEKTAKRQIEDFHFWINGAEWQFLSRAIGDVEVPAGKRVQLRVSMSLYRQPKKLSALEKIGKDDLYSVIMQAGLNAGEKPTNLCVKYISHLTSLRELNLSGASVNSQGLKFITGMQQLEELYAPKFVYEDGMKELVKLSNLKRLHFTESRISDEDLKYLRELRLLQELSLNSTKVTDEGLKYLADCPNLYYLYIWGDFTDEGLKNLTSLAALKIIRAHSNDNKISDEGLRYVSQIKTLERFWAYWMENITDKGVEHIVQLPNLKMLDLGHAKLSNKACEFLKQNQSITHLSLPFQGIDEEGIKNLSELKKLETLMICSASSSPLTDRALEYISNMTNLKELTICGLNFTDEGIKNLTRLQNLENLLIGDAPKLTNKCLEDIAKLKNMRDLGLPQDANLTISGLKSLNSLENLERLDLYRILQDNTGMDISGLKNLKILAIGLDNKEDNRLRDSDLACLSQLKNLEDLSISTVGIGNEGLKHLQNLTNIHRLQLLNSKIDDEGLRYLSRMEKLVDLWISGADFSGEGFKYLHNLKRIQRLEIHSYKRVNQQYINRLRKELPELNRLIINYKPKPIYLKENKEKLRT